MTDTLQNWFYSMALMLLVMASAIACIYAKHESRKQFTELQRLIEERDRMEVDWGRLQIEQGTWSTYARVEQVAREKMNMRLPKAGQINLLSR
ncbi:MAG: cell division protein FtsL [Gammaproteobacteria bacterium]|nr:cell division protein FtsL [Gammaproteobacteria bacterium]